MTFQGTQFENEGLEGNLEKSLRWFLNLVGTIIGLGDDLIAVSADKVLPKKLRWLWPDRVPRGSLTLFVGNPDNGKSLAAIYVVATTSTGCDWYSPKGPMKNPHPASEVLIFADEDGIAEVLVPRLMAAEANRALISMCKMRVVRADASQEERQMSLVSDLGTIRRHIEKHPTIRLVVLDPLSNYIGNINMNSELEVRQVLMPLQKLAEEMSVAILAVMHLNKDQNKRATSRVGGAMAFVGVARSVWMFDSDINMPGEFHMVRLKQNIAEQKGGLRYRIVTKGVPIEGENVQQPVIEWIGESRHSADEIVAAHVPKQGRPPNKLKAAIEFIRSFVDNRDIPQAEIAQEAERAGISSSTLARAKNALKVESVRTGDRWSWHRSEQDE